MTWNLLQSSSLIWFPWLYYCHKKVLLKAKPISHNHCLTTFLISSLNRFGKSIVELLVKHGLVVAGLAQRTIGLRLIQKLLKVKKVNCIVSNATWPNKTKSSTFEAITHHLRSIGDIEKWKPVLDTNVLAVAYALERR